MAVGKASIRRAADANLKENASFVRKPKEASEQLLSQRASLDKLHQGTEKALSADNKTDVIISAVIEKPFHPIKIYCELPDYLL